MEDALTEETPPRKWGGTFDYDAIAERLRSKPGQWFVVKEGVSLDRRANLRMMMASALSRRGDGFEVTSRSAEGKIYARWVRDG